ncbi:hypothetical protein P3T36_007718 [Kitasatospora sp. MAP12-15]|uniref:hypothetical protein n=1 Tax=unclassified Kitasatospora TaxID=2633591 RepID=UPI002475200C|nr:hypothetical protein [Kitasatospora sp. MAP12-44]MDH6108538.1 hypothetical protein [Kitasatospora sp. MAP12-44]
MVIVLHPHDSLQYARRSAAANAWFGTVLEAAQEGDWRLDDIERRIVNDVLNATYPLTSGMPPYTEESLRIRVLRIASWAAILRLAAAAGGWTLFPVTNQDPDGLTRQVGMADLLSAIYTLAEQGEQWQQMIMTAVRGNLIPRGQSVEQWASEHSPGLKRDLANAEHFFSGPGSLEDTLHDIATAHAG